MPREILDAFESSGEVLRLRDVVQRTGFSKGMCFRLLHTLHHCGFIEKVDELRFRMTAEIPPAQTLPDRLCGAGTEQLVRPRGPCQPGRRRAALRHRADRRRQPLSAEDRPSERRSPRPRRTSTSSSSSRPTRPSRPRLPRATSRRASRLSPSTSRIPARPTSAPTTTRPALLAGRYLGRWAKSKWRGEVDEILLLELARAGSLVRARLSGILAGIVEALHRAAGRAGRAHRRRRTVQDLARAGPQTSPSVEGETHSGRRRQRPERARRRARLPGGQPRRALRDCRAERRTGRARRTPRSADFSRRLGRLLPRALRRRSPSGSRSTSWRGGPFRRPSSFTIR